MIVREPILQVSMRMATEEDREQGLETYDNTKLTAANTCPTWGVLRYQMHRVYSTSARAMALEAGSAMHEVFAAQRLWQLWKVDTVDSPHRQTLFQHHGLRMFGEERFDDMLNSIARQEDDRSSCLNFCLRALYNCGFHDDPYDTRRTMSNLEEAAIMYIDRWDQHKRPIWIRDHNDPISDVGIEIIYDVVITITTAASERQLRFTGKLDGLQYESTQRDVIAVDENKTAGRLDDAWRLSFEMSSQVTGYMLAASVFTGQPVTSGRVLGVQLPLPKNYDIGGLAVEHVHRSSYQFAQWFDWLLHTVEMYDVYRHDPINAPKYTHSCNRYFFPCAFIPFCTADKEEQEAHLREMPVEEWSPLHELKGNE